MEVQQPPNWWPNGDTCDACGIPFCSRHSPNMGVKNKAIEYGPLETTGLELEMLGPIEVYFLDRHTGFLGERTRVGQAVYNGKSYDRRPGSQQSADLVASAAALWLGTLFGSGRVDRPVAVVAVPAKPERKGISLPAILAEAVGTKLDIPVVAPFRWLAGTAQAKALAKDLRQRALDPCLETISAVPAGTMLLVDDVFETGATISVVARRLREAGATKVIAFAPSRALGRQRF